MKKVLDAQMALGLTTVPLHVRRIRAAAKTHPLLFPQDYQLNL